MRATGGKGESASLLLGVRGGLFLRLGESEYRSSGEFRPLSRPERTRWRRVCASRGPGDRRRRRRRGCGGRLAALVLASLAAAGGFPDPERGGSASSARPGKGGKCQFSPTRKGGGTASFAGGDHPPLAASRWGCLASTRPGVHAAGPPPDVGGEPEVSEASESVVRSGIQAGLPNLLGRQSEIRFAATTSRLWTCGETSSLTRAPVAWCG